MKKVFKDTSFLCVWGFKKKFLTLMLYFAITFGMISTAEAISTHHTHPPTLKENAPPLYIVKKGDTLWAIAQKFLNNPLRWPEIWASNQYIKNPHWIFPGDRLLMCSDNGSPLIGKDEGDGCSGVIQRHHQTQILYPQVRIESLNQAIPVIPLDDIQQWLDRSFILPETAIENTPYIVGAADHRVIAGAGQNVYARGQGLKVGQFYGIYTKGKPYIVHNEQGQKINAGLELTQVALAVVSNIDKDIATLEIKKSYDQEVRRNNLVLPEHEVLYPTMFYPIAADNVSANGKIIRIHDSINAATKRSIVSINQGTAQGVKVGDVYTVNQAGQVIKDPKTHKKLQLPTERIGEIMVIQTFGHVSYAYVLESQLPIYVDATLTPPTLSH